MKVRLWGSPACGQVKEGVEPISEIWRVMTAPKVRIQEPIEPNFTLNVWEYHESR